MVGVVILVGDNERAELSGDANRKTRVVTALAAAPTKPLMVGK